MDHEQPVSDADANRHVAAAFIKTLRARGLELHVAGNRLRLTPWLELTGAERDTLRKYRQTIKTLVREGAGR